MSMLNRTEWVVLALGVGFLIYFIVHAMYDPSADASVRSSLLSMSKENNFQNVQDNCEQVACERFFSEFGREENENLPYKSFSEETTKQ